MYDEEKKEIKTGDNTPAWMLTFADLVSLLICFFVLLYAMKTVDEDIWKQITGSFAGALNYSQKFKEISPNNDSNSEANRILTSDSIEYTESVLATKFAREGLIDIVSFSKDEETSALHITMPGDHMFVNNSIQISKKGEKILSFITETVQYLDNDIEVASYVEEDHQGLAMQKSMFRSLAVREFLKRKGNTKSIKIIGYGSSEYEKLKNFLKPYELRQKAVRLDFIIKSK